MATMKKLILLALLAVMIAGCSNDAYQNEYAKRVTVSDFAILELDSCEYLLRVTPYNGFLSHKGNCRFCKERRQKELEELIIKLKAECDKSVNYGDLQRYSPKR